MPDDQLARLLDGQRVAVVQEWIAARAGSEQVFEAIARAIPNADLFALTHDPEVQLEINGRRRIRTTWLDTARFRYRRHLTLPLMPVAWHTASKDDYDLVITSSHAFARWFRPARHAVHFSYVHTPLRYVWTPEVDDRGSPWWARLAAPAMKSVDRRSVLWTDHFAANSSEVATRIRQFYGREAKVIHPPVAIDRFLATPMAPPKHRSGLLAFGRWVSYKRFDIAIAVAERVGEHVTIAGRGPMREQIHRMADNSTAHVSVIESPTDVEVERLLGTHRLLLFPGREDFGLVPVEAAASGLPVVALDAGGARDIIEQGTTGLLVRESTDEAFGEAVARALAIDWDQERIRRHSVNFSSEAFVDNLTGWISSRIAGPQMPTP